jgi:uncharacterized cupin superfamily protein
MSESRPKPATSPVLVRASERGPELGPHSHPFNPQSRVFGHLLGAQTGLKRLGVNVFRVPPGKESFILHSHHTEEEWLYILSGRGIAVLGDGEHEVGPGDFMGFPAPSVAHHLRNPFTEDLVYLSGGEKRDAEVADFPTLGKRMVRLGQDVTIYPLSAGAPFPSE